MLRAIADIDEHLEGDRHPHEIFEPAEDRWISDAEVAEIAYTAFTSRRQAKHVTGRLIVLGRERLVLLVDLDGAGDIRDYKSFDQIYRTGQPWLIAQSSASSTTS